MNGRRSWKAQAIRTSKRASTASRAAATRTGTVIVSRSQDRLVFLAAGLAPLPQDRTYQLWQIAPGKIRSAGLLRPGTGGYTAPVVTAPAPGATQMGLTVEPAGGSTQPSTQPLLLVNMPAA